MINLNYIDNLKIYLDNEVASHDTLYYDEIVSGIEIDTSRLNINSLIKFITVIRKYKNEEEKKNLMENMVNCFEEGYYIGYVEFTEILDKSKDIVVDEGETVYAFRIKLKDNSIQFCSTDIDQHANSNDVIYLKVYGETEDVFPADYIIRFFDIKRNLIQENEVTIINPNTIVDVPLREYSYLSYIENLLSDQDKKSYLTQRNYNVKLKGMNVILSYNSGMEDLFLDYILDDFKIAENNITYQKEDNYIFVGYQIAANSLRSYSNMGYIFVRYADTVINSGDFYCIKKIDYNEYSSMLVNHNTVKLNLGCYDDEKCLWLLYEDLESEDSNTARIRYRIYIGNNVIFED